MKKIVVVTNSMVYGGIEKSLIELLHYLIINNDVTLILASKNGELFSKIPEKVKIKIMYKGQKKNLLKMYYKLRLRTTKNFSKECNILTKIYDHDDETYDLAIAYSTPVSLPNYYVIRNLIAKKKIMYLHNDIDRISVSPLSSKLLFRKYDNIIAVSYNCKKSFIELFPELSNKVIILENLVDETNILKLSYEPIIPKTFDRGFIHICTVGRIEREKGQDIVPEVLFLLKQKRYNVKWHLIGDGSLVKTITDRADELKVSDMMVFEGYQDNPYKYMRSSDIYVQTSRQEGFCITLKEAKILRKIIISTDFPTAYEQINNNINGVIVPFDPLSLATAVIKIIEDNKMRNTLLNNLIHIDNRTSYDALDKFLEEVFDE